ncbi:MAG: efflux family protein [Proteobacteria bacterium]|nr:efflux family protein [Pseudomonadota bacterium]
MKLAIRPDVVKLATPILFEQMFVNLLGIVNTIMASRLGKEAVSAIGMVDAINAIIGALISALAIGATVVVAQLTGRGQRETAAHASLQALVAGGLIATGLTVLLVLARAPVLHLLYRGIDPQVMAHMETYLSISALSYPLTALTVIGCGALRGAGETRSTMEVNTLINVLNVILSYVLIYGMHLRTEWMVITIPGFGVAGAGMALTLARASGVLYLFWTVLLRGDFLPDMRLRDFRFDRGLQRAIFAIGIPASIESMIFNGGKLIVQVFIVGMGTVAIAANYIAFSVSNLINIPGAALAVALTTLVGHDAGRADYDAARRSMWHVLKVAWVCMAIIGLVFIPLAPAAVGLYSQDAEVIHVGSLLVRMNCVFLICYPTTFVLPNGLKGSGDARFTVLTTLTGMLLFRLMLGYFLGVTLGYGVVGVWCGVIADWFVRSALYVIRLRGTRWQRQALSIRHKQYN